MNRSERKAVAVYRKMRKRDYSPILETAMRECNVKSKKRAKELMNSFLQWFALIPEASEPLQMLQSVDRIWHAFVLNTRLYREFCNEFVGRYVDHDPADLVNSAKTKRRYANYTLRRLKAAYGKSVGQDLLNLRENVTCCCACGSIKPDVGEAEYSFDSSAFELGFVGAL